MIGISWSGPKKLGDQVSITHIPENFYKHYNAKLIDLTGLEVFERNPYLIREGEPTEIRDIWKLWMNANVEGATLAEKQCRAFGIECYLNRPNLYYPIKPSLFRCIVVHTTSSRACISQKVINHIRDTKNGFLFQVGAKSDVDAGLMDRRGEEFWKTVDYISQAEEVICLDSCVYHIARSFPHIRIKVVLAGLTKQECRDFHPLWFDKGVNSGWIQMGDSYYNEYEESLGITSSYLDI